MARGTVEAKVGEAPEKAIESSDLAKLASICNDLLFRYDFRTNTFWAGDRAFELVGCPKNADGTFTPGYISSRIHASDAPHILQSIAVTLLEQGPQWEGRCRLRKNETEYFNVRVRALLEYENGQISRVLGAISEIERSSGDHLLAESEQRYHDLIDSIGEGILLTDAQYRITFCNAKFRQMLGCKAEEAYLRDSVEFVHPDDRHLIFAAREARKSGVAGSYDVRLITSDGQTIWAMVSVRPMMDESGTFTGILAALTDITKRKQVEAQLLQVVESDLGGIIYWDISGRIARANKAFLRMTGYTAADLERGLNWMELTPVEWHEADRGAIDAMLSGMGAPVYAKEFFARSGRRIPVLLRSVLLPGSRTEGVAFVLDNTQKERVRRELERLARIVETTSDAIILLTPEGQIVSWNSGAERLYGHRAEEAVGRSGQVLIPPGQQWGFHEIAKRLQAGEILENVETTHVTARGEEKPVSLTISAVFDDHGTLRGISQIARDMSARKHAESLEAERRDAQKLEAIGRLAGGVAHEFNNLLMIIMSNVQLAQEQVRDGENVDENFNEVVEACDRAAELTQQLLAFGRRQMQKIEELDPNEAVSETLRFARRVIGENITTEFESGESLGAIRADRGQFKQILLNLCLNARDAMPNGGKIKVRTSAMTTSSPEDNPYAAPEGSYVQVEVADNGVGMQDTVRARVFEPFFTTKEFGKGTGLGLATVYGIVKQNGGFIHLDSELGKGTTFRLCFPVVEASRRAAVEDCPSQTLSGSELVLLVEDEESLRSAVKRYLLSRGFRVLEARDGEEGWRVSEESKEEIDLVLTDVVMPRMGGVEMVRKVREQRPNVPVIYMSGYTDGEAVVDSELSETMLQKPFNMTTLAAELQRRLAIRRSSEASTAL